MTDTTTNGTGPERRKIQLTGGSTYTVSIPKGWAEERDIGSGSDVLLYPFTDRLVVTQPVEESPTHRTSLNVDAVDADAIGRRIVAAYSAGADEICVESDTGFDSSQRRIATTAIRDLIGLEIASETERELVAECLLDPAEISLESTIAQLRQISLSMQARAIGAVLATEDELEADEIAERVMSRDDDVDRLFALVSRQFYRVLGDVREVRELQTSRTAAFTQFRIARQLERVGDHAELVATLATRQSSPPGDDLADQFESVANDARRVVRTALDGNTGEALLRRDDVVENLEALDRELYTTPGEDMYLYGRVLESIRRTAEYGVNIAEIITLGDITEPIQ